MLYDLAQPLFKPFRQHSLTKSNTNHKGTPDPTGALIELQSPSDGITHAGAIEISRFGLTPQPPIVKGC